MIVAAEITSEANDKKQMLPAFAFAQGYEGYPATFSFTVDIK